MEWRTSSARNATVTNFEDRSINRYLSSILVYQRRVKDAKYIFSIIGKKKKKILVVLYISRVSFINNNRWETNIFPREIIFKNRSKIERDGRDVFGKEMEDLRVDGFEGLASINSAKKRTAWNRNIHMEYGYFNMIRLDLSSWRPAGISPSLAVLSAKKCHLSLSLKRSIDFDMESRFGTNTST